MPPPPLPPIFPPLDDDDDDDIINEFFYMMPISCTKLSHTRQKNKSNLYGVMQSILVCVFLCFLFDTLICPILGPLVTSLGFKARVGSALFAFAEEKVLYIP